MKKSLVILVLYLMLGSEGFSGHFRSIPRPFRGYSGPTPISPGYSSAQFYNPAGYFPSSYTLFRSFYTPNRYLGSQYLPQQLSTMPLGWNRYYLTAKMQAPYSLIIRNAPQYSSYRDSEFEEPPHPSGPPVSLYRIPLRGAAAQPMGWQDSTVVHKGMTEEQVKAGLGPPMIQVVLGDTRSYVYDELLVEFDKGRVKNVTFK